MPQTWVEMVKESEFNFEFSFIDHISTYSTLFEGWNKTLFPTTMKTIGDILL